MKRMIIIFIFLLVIVTSNAQEISVERTLPPSVSVGETFPVKIKVSNGMSQKAFIQIEDNLPNAEPVDTTNLKQGSPSSGLIAFRMPYYYWEFELEPSEIKIVEYTLQAQKPGSIDFSPVRVTAEDINYYSDSQILLVECNKNSICEQVIDENINNCPSDCLSGSEDNYCDLMKDGKCDPDCTDDTDPDCRQAAVCGDGKCDTSENELICPTDCKEVVETPPDEKPPIEENPPIKDDKPTKQKSSGLTKLILVLLILSMIMVIVIVYYRRRLKSNV